MTTSRPSRTWPFDLVKAIVALLLLAAMLYLRPDLSTALQRQLGLPVGSVTVLEAPKTASGSAAVTLSGRTQAGATVELFAGASRLGSATAAADGTWSLPVTLPTGSYDLRAQALDAAGSALGAPAVLAWSSAAQPADQPDAQAGESTSAVTAGGETPGGETAGGETPGGETGAIDDSSPAASNTGESTAGDDSDSGETAVGETAVVTASEETAVAAVASSNTARASADAASASSNAAGASSGAPGPTPDAADVPSEPAGPAANAADAARTGAVAGAAFAVRPEPAAVSPQGVTLRGTGTPGAVVDIVGAEGSLGSTIVDPEGGWAVELALPPGPYELLARMTDPTGELQSAPVVSVTVPDTATPDTTAPDTTAPDTTAPDAASASTQATLGAAQVLAGSANLSGSGAPGATVEVIVTAAGAGGAGTSTAAETVLGSTTVGPDGLWSLTGSVAPGEYQLSLRTLDEDSAVVDTTPAVPFSVPSAADEEGAGLAAVAGEETAASSAPAAVQGTVTATVASVTPGTATTGTATTGTATTGTAITSTATNTATGTATTAARPAVTARTAPTATAASTTLTTRPAQTPTATSLAAPSFAQPTYAGNTLTLRGAGEPGSTVEIVSGATVVAAAEVGPDGQWSLTAEIAPGNYQLQLLRKDAAGTVTGQSPVVALKIPAAETTLTVAEPETGADNTVTLTGTGNPGSIIEVVQDGTVVVTTTVQTDGTWRYAYQPATVGETDVAVQLRGQPQTRTQPIVVVVPITVAPATPTATAAATALPAATATPQPQAEAETGSDTGGQAYVVQTGDTLTGLAQQYLGNQARYREIVAATNEKAQGDAAIDPIPNPDLISVGQTIWIPAP